MSLVADSPLSDPKNSRVALRADAAGDAHMLV
jgi:hypothetical protein